MRCPWDARAGMIPCRDVSGVAEGLGPLGPELGEKFRKEGGYLKSWGTSHLFSLILINILPQRDGSRNDSPR